MTWPFVVSMTDSTAPGQDPLLQAWIARWIQHALWTEPTNLFNANANYPFDLTLAYSDANIPVALLAAPIQWVTGDAILAINLLTLATFPLAAVGMYLLVRRLTGQAWVAFVAGLAFAFLPYRFAHLWHLNQLGHAWTPWVLWALFRLRDRPSWRAASAFGALAAVQALTSFGLALQLAIVLLFVLAALVIDDERARTGEFLVRLSGATAAAAVVVGLLYLPYLLVRDQQGLERELSESEAYKAIPSSYLTVPPWDDPFPLIGSGQRKAQNLVLLDEDEFRRSPDGHVHEEIVAEDTLFPGFAVMAAAAVGLWAFRRNRLVRAFAACGILAAILTLGPTWGRPARVPLPYAFFFDHVPLFRGLRTPARFGALVALCLIVVAAFGACTAHNRLRAGLARRRAGRAALPPSREVRGVAVPVLAGLLVVIEFWAAPVPLDTVNRSTDAPYEWLRQQPPGPVMEFPASPLFGGPEATATRRHVGEALYWSTKHWKPLVNGVSGFVPTPYIQLLNAFEGNLERPTGEVSPRVSHVSTDTAGLLLQLGVRYLMIHRDYYDPEDWPGVEDALRDAGGAIEHAKTAGRVELYRVRTAAATPPTPSLRVYLPTQAVARRYWEPAFVIENSAAVKSMLYTRRPVKLTMTWTDEDGGVVRRDERLLKSLPAVVAPGQHNCSIDGCHMAVPGDPPTTPERTLGLPRLTPSTPGTYTVRLELTGGIQEACLLSGIEVLAPGIRGGENAWLGCDGGVLLGDAPALEGAFRSTSPRVSVTRDRIEVSTRFTSISNERIRGWFFVADPGETEPWKNHVYKSHDIEREVRSRHGTDFAWTERVALPPGRYRVTVWFHYAEGSRWIHAFGGDLEAGEIVVR